MGPPAQRSGLREGDILLKAEGMELVRVSDLREAVEEALDRGSVRLTVSRAGRVFEVETEIMVSE